MNTVHDPHPERNTRARHDLCLETIPAELKGLRQWVLFRLKPKPNGKRDKIPLNPHTGERAAVDDKTTWGTFEEAVAAYLKGRGHGLGFVFTASDPYVGVDLDTCRDPRTGRLTLLAQEVLQRLPSYAEWSVSEKGLHAFAKGTLPHGAGKNKVIEMYDRGRFFAMTGRQVPGTPRTIAECQAALLALFAQHFPHKTNGHAAAQGSRNGAPHASTRNPKSDDEILRLAQSAKNGEKFSRLWQGDATLWTVEPKEYPSQSEADLALCSLLVFYCGHDPACIERLFRRSGLYREKWDREDYVTRTIATALHNRQDFYGGGGRVAAGEDDDEDDDEEETEEEENARILKEERPVEDPWPCPPHLWRGPFKKVAQAVGKWTWDVWLAVLVALGAKAHRNIDLKYHRRLFGMVYALLIKGTGMGKGLSTDICRGLLLPEGYSIADAVQSGPALAPILADIERDAKGKVESVSPHPALLLIEEFTVLLKNAAIQHSTIIDSINSLFHRTWPWNVSRTDRPNGGGGHLVIENPTLSILATTTQALFKDYVSPQMIRSGFLNRFLVIPGDTTPWKFYDPDGAGRTIDPHEDLLGDIPYYKFHHEKVVWDVYTPEALDRIKSWGEQTFEPIMNSAELEAESVKRLHAYSHVIGLLYAYGERTPFVTLEHVECAISAITTSMAFLQSLVRAEGETAVPQFKAYEISLEQKILAKVKEAGAGGIPRRKIVGPLTGKTATSPDLYTLITKMVHVGTLREVRTHTPGARKKTIRLYLPEHNPNRKKKENEHQNVCQNV